MLYLGEKPQRGPRDVSPYVVTTYDDKK
jgi:hypothetical protein